MACTHDVGLNKLIIDYVIDISLTQWGVEHAGCQYKVSIESECNDLKLGIEMKI